MNVRTQILTAVLFAAATPTAHSAPGDALAWSPPTLVPTRAVAAPAEAVAVVTAPEPTAAESAAPTAKPVRRARPPRKAPRKGKDRCTPSVAPTIDPRLAEARAEREQILAVARPMAVEGHLGRAAQMLGLAARTHADPILFLAAAEAELADPKIDHERLERASRLAEEAQQMISAPRDLRISVEEGPRLSADVKALVETITARRTLLRQARRGRAELACGIGFIVLGATGLGMIVSGGALTSRVEAARDRYSGQDATYLEALEQTGDRADTLLAVGAISGLVGAAIGIPLTIAGSRDLKRAGKATGERPNLHFQPGLASFSIAAKF